MVGAAPAIPAAYVLSIATMRVGDVSFVPFRYTAVMFATILSCLLSGQLPDRLSFLGTILVISAGLYCYIVNIC